MPTASSGTRNSSVPPNEWQLGSDGKLTRTFETQEYKAAVGYVRDLYASGLFHPNTRKSAADRMRAVISLAANGPSGLTGLRSAWSDPWRRARMATNPFEVHMIPLFGAQDGVKP